MGLKWQIDRTSNFVPSQSPTKTTLLVFLKVIIPHGWGKQERRQIATKFWNPEKSVVTDLTDSRKPNSLPDLKTNVICTPCSDIKVKWGGQSKEEQGEKYFWKVRFQLFPLTPCLWMTAPLSLEWKTPRHSKAHLRIRAPHLRGKLQGHWMVCSLPLLGSFYPEMPASRQYSLGRNLEDTPWERWHLKDHWYRCHPTNGTVSSSYCDTEATFQSTLPSLNFDYEQIIQDY